MEQYMTMSRLFVAAAVAAVVPVLAVAQAAPQRLQFEAASVRPTPTADLGVKIGMHADGAQMRFDFLSLRDLTRIAWQVKDYQILGPDWIASERYTVTAKVPAGNFTEEQKREMLQNLLIDRFGLKYHREKKEFAVYALEQGKNGVKMKETPADAGGEAAPAPKSLDISASGSERGVYVDLGGGAYFSFADNKFVGHKITMPRIVDSLAMYLDKPLIDETGLPADQPYELTLAITPEDYRVMLIRSGIHAGVQLPPQALQIAEGPIDSFYSALDTAGLKLESKRAPVDVIVVDSANKTPTEN
jgi:uncharacterized protein (TIGR03435 family)